jgi:hypothetical protein
MPRPLAQFIPQRPNVGLWRPHSAANCRAVDSVLHCRPALLHYTDAGDLRSIEDLFGHAWLATQVYTAVDAVRLMKVYRTTLPLCPLS